MNQPLEHFFHAIRREVVSAVTWSPGQAVAISGQMDQGWFNYSLEAIDGDQRRVRVRPPSERAYSGFRIGTRSGTTNPRIVGLDRLWRGLTEVVGKRRLKGGRYWLNERLVSRLRLIGYKLKRAFPLERELADLRCQLLPLEHYLVESSWGGRRFSGRDVIDDLDELASLGAAKLELWWLPHDRGPENYSLDQDVLQQLLDEHWRRSQLVYDEIVTHSFDDIKCELGFHGALPVRFRVQVYNRPETYGRGCQETWYPVPDWSMAGADVEVADFESFYHEELFRSVQDELARLGRRTTSSVWVMQTGLPRFDGTTRHGPFNGETSALRSAAGMLGKDLNRLFKFAPDTGAGRAKLVEH